MKAKKMYFMDCRLAGRKYYDADIVWDQLRIGTRVELNRDPDNRYDKNAVAVMYTYETGLVPEQYQLGYIPSEDNEILAKFLEMGWYDMFECHISRITPDANYDNQIRLTIRIRRKEDAENADYID